MPSARTLLPAPADGSDNALWGFVDEGGAWAIDPRFEDAYRFREGLAPVRQDGRWGYVDQSGTVVIQPEFTEAYYFNGGLARVATGPSPDLEDPYFVTASGYGFIDKTGKMVIPAEWDDAGEFSEGLAPVMKGKACGFINSSGEIVIPLKFDCAVSFSEGLAPVSVGGDWGYIDNTGKWVIQPQFASPIPASVPDDTYLLPARGFHDGLASVHADGATANDLGTWQYIDKAGRKAFERGFYLAGEFSEGLAPVFVESEGWGFVSPSGAMSIEPQFEWTFYFNHDSYLSSYQGFHQGLAAVVLNGKVGYIDNRGTFVIAPQFAKANAFRDGFAFVQPLAPSTVTTRTEQFPGGLGAAEWIDLTGRVIYQAPSGQ